MKKMTLCTIASSAIFLCGAAHAADSPATADVLAKLHQSNQKEIQMGKLAQKSGQSRDVKNFGKTLVKDHSAADKKVMALAKQEKIDLATTTGGAEKPMAMKDDDSMANMGSGPDFDLKFGQSMLDDHKKDIADATSARDSTTDAKLKKLLDGMIPTLQKHEDSSQKIVDTAKASPKKS
jgi:putative membrane protein